jgi:hypothetical protein
MPLSPGERGVGVREGRANGARIDSRNGSASVTAAPRRKQRREFGRRVEAKGNVEPG